MKNAVYDNAQKAVALMSENQVRRIPVVNDDDMHYDGIVAFSRTDFTEDLKKITVRFS